MTKNNTSKLTILIFAAILVFFSVIPVVLAEETPAPETTPEASSTPEQTATSTPEASSTPEQTASPTPEPTNTEEPTATPSPQPTTTAQQTETPTPDATEQSTPTPTPEPLSSDAQLVSVSINGSSISISGGSGSYSTPARDMSLIVVTSSTEATVSANGISQSHSGNSTFTFSKNSVDSFSWDIVITAEDGTTTNSFTIDVTRTVPYKPTTAIQHSEGSNTYLFYPKDHGYCTSSFAYYRKKGSSQWISLYEKRLTVGENMNENTVYEVCMRTSNSIGYSEYSDIIELGPYQVIKAGEIVNFDYTQEGDTFTFTWDCANGYDSEEYSISIYHGGNGSSRIVKTKQFVYMIPAGDTISLSIKVSFAGDSGETLHLEITNNNPVDTSSPPKSVPTFLAGRISDDNITIWAYNSTGSLKIKFLYKTNDGIIKTLSDSYYNSDHTQATVPLSVFLGDQIQGSFGFSGCFYNDAGEGEYAPWRSTTITRDCIFDTSQTNNSTSVTLYWNSLPSLDHFIIERIITFYDNTYNTDMAVKVRGSSYTIALPDSQGIRSVSFRILVDSSYYPGISENHHFKRIDFNSYNIHTPEIEGPLPTPTQNNGGQTGGGGNGSNPTAEPTPTPDYSTDLSQNAQVNGVDIELEAESEDVTVEISQDTLQQLGDIDDAQNILVKTEIVKTDTDKYYTMIDDDAKLITDLLSFEVIVTDSEGNESQVTQFDEPIKITVELDDEQVSQIESIDDLIMYYVDPLTGAVEKFDVGYDEESGEITFYTNHFSVYVLVETKSFTLPIFWIVFIIILLAFDVLIITIAVKMKKEKSKPKALTV